MEWVECVPNSSEGRDPSLIDALAAAIDIQAKGLKLTGVPKYR